LNPRLNVFTELQRAAPEAPEQDLRRVLGAFLFSGDEIYKPVSVLSGGEKARVALARLLMQPGNLLLMDEPTNHLDIPSREILADALDAYRGTLCLITHDRTLIRQIANKIIAIKNGRLEIFPGDYDSYLYWLESGAQARPAVKLDNAAPSNRKASPRRRPAGGTSPYTLRQRAAEIARKIADVEAKLARLEPELREIEATFADPSHYRDGTKVSGSVERYRRLQEEVRTLTGEWDKLTAAAEALKQHPESN
jgi:ATP-binding cassette subfamily F protein 3